MKKKKNRIGVMSGITKEFTISNKKRLQDPLILELNGQLVSKSTETWIRKHPQTLYDNYYKNNKGIHLTSEAFHLFKNVLREKHLDLIEAILIQGGFLF